MTQTIWLLSTAHLKNHLWFLDEDDFKTGMNLVAITTTKVPVRVLSFSLMSNHVHFILSGRREAADAFINYFKRAYSRYMHNKYGLKEFLRENEVDIRPIQQEGESAERAIAYVHMNCVAANICAHPAEYEWSSAACPFRVRKSQGIHLDQLSERERIRLFHSKVRLPEEWLLGKESYILPECYVDYQFVERIFRTPKRMNYFLNNSSKARMRVETSETALPSFKDQVIISALGDLLRTLFHKNLLEELSDDEMTEYFRQIRFRFSADISQIARVTGSSYETVAKHLDSI